MTYTIRPKTPIVTPKTIIEMEEGEVINDPILEALLENNAQDLSSYLNNNLEVQVTEEHIIATLEINSSLLEILLSHNTAQVTAYIICEAIDDKNLKALQILLNHSTAKVEGWIINHAIQNKQLDALEILLNHSTAKVESWIITDSIKDQEILNLLNYKLTNNSDTKEVQEIETLFSECNITDSSEELSQNTTLICEVSIEKLQKII